MSTRYAVRRIRRGTVQWQTVGVRRPDLIDLALVVSGAAVALATTDRSTSPYVVTVLFVTTMLALIGLVLRQAVASGREAHREHLHARRLGDIDPGGVARSAVREERVRLAAELDSCIREALEAVRAELGAGELAGDLREPARRIQQRAREATSELRRQLGLLRSLEDDDAAEEVPPASPGLTRRSVLLALLVALVAGAEARIYLTTDDLPADVYHEVWTPLLTAAAAFTVVGRRIAPVAAATLLAVLFVVPQLAVGVGVASGGWLVVTVGALVWTLAARGLRDVRAVLACALLAGAVIGIPLHDDPDNAGIAAVLVAIAWIAGLAVGMSRRRATAAANRAALLEANLDSARHEAVQAERLTIARDLHDTVSHAVGVIAIQAGAAEAAWPDDPQTARRALRTIDTTAADALVELDRVAPGSAPASPHDLAALVRRIRATGTSVRLTLVGTSATEVDGVAYRVVQEGLTNGIRHAPGARLDLRVEGVPSGLRVRVSDDGGPSAPWPRRGFGLAGLAERVTLAGGTLQAGPRPGGGGFVVEAWLPADRAAVGERL